MLFSGDRGYTWQTRGMVTGFAQQTACLVQLKSAIAIVFSHKDFANTSSGSFEHYGQRAILSYDEGRRWSNAILELHHGGMYASSVSLQPEPDGSQIVVSAFGDDSARLGAIRWRVPPRSSVEAYGTFAPIPIREPMPAPLPPGLPQPPLPPLPLPPPPAEAKAAGYGPPCATLWETPGDGTPDVLNCYWSLYTPILRPWPAREQFNHSTKGFIEPTIVAGSHFGHEVLLVQSGAEISISRTAGRSFAPLCVYPGAHRPAGAGFANGLGLLSDGTLLAAHYYSDADGIRTMVFRGKLPTVGGLVGSSAGGTDCGWSKGFVLPPIGSQKNSVGGGLGIRFTEGTVPDDDGNDVTAVLFAVRNQEEFTAEGHPIPKSAQASYAVIYRSTNSGRTFAVHGRLSNNTAEADLLVLPRAAPGANAQLAGTVVATSRYQTRHFASARYDTGVLRNDTTVSYKATAVFRSTNGGRSWSPPGLVTGRGQQSGCLVRLDDGTIILPFGHKDAVSQRTAPSF